MIHFRRHGFTLLEIIVAVTILAAVVAGSMTVIPKAINSLRNTQKSSIFLQEARNLNEVLLSRTFDEIKNACQLKNPCHLDNSNLSSLFHSSITLDNVFISIVFYDGSGNVTLDMNKATFARITIMIAPSDNSEPIVLQSGIASDFGPSSPYVGSVKGVIRSSGSISQGIADARVTLKSISNSNIVYEVYTNNSGVFHIAGIIPGQYNLTIQKPYFITKNQSNILVDGHKDLGTIYIDEKPFKQIFSDHFTSTSNLDTAASLNIQVQNSKLQLAENQSIIYENPNFSYYHGQSNVTRTSTSVELSKTLKSGNWMIGSDDKKYTNLVGHSACNRGIDSGWVNGNQITYAGQIYTKGRIEFQPGQYNYDGGLRLCDGIIPMLIGWGNFDFGFRITNNNTPIGGNEYWYASDAKGGDYWLSTVSVNLSQIPSSLNLRLQSRTTLTGTSPPQVGAISRNFRLYGTERYEYYSSGYVYADYDLGREVNRIRVDWDATTPSGTSVVFKVILYKDSSHEYTLSKNTWFQLPKATRYIRIKAELTTNNPLVTPQLRNYRLYVPAYSTTGHAITKSFSSPDGSGTDQIILRVSGEETQSQNGGEEKLARVCEVYKTTLIFFERNCQDFSSNYVQSSLWPGVSLELKRTGNATLTVTDTSHHENVSVEASMHGREGHVVRNFYIGYAQTFHLDYTISVHASLFTRDCAIVIIFNPSGQEKFRQELCGNSARIQSKYESKTNIAITASSSEIGLWSVMVDLRGYGGFNHDPMYSTVTARVRHKVLMSENYTINVSDQNIFTAKQTGPLHPYTINLRVKQLYQPAPPSTSLQYQISNNGGSTWVTVTPNMPIKMPQPGQNYRVKILLNGHPSATPRLDYIQLEGRSP